MLKLSPSLFFWPKKSSFFLFFSTLVIFWLKKSFLQLLDTLHVLSRHHRCSFQTLSIISRQHSDTTQYLPEPNWAKPIKSGPSRHLPGTFQAPSRHLPDTFQRPSRHPPNTFQTHLVSSRKIDQFKKKVCENRTFESKVRSNLSSDQQLKWVVHLTSLIRQISQSGKFSKCSFLRFLNRHRKKFVK